ncbi:MAG: sulfatase-like hydrolase/transferase [Bacillota bacterium]|nr:sulfatase-like hydrolase/transferase [Bacillota bacterium]
MKLEKLKTLFRNFQQKPLIACAVLSILLTFILEILGRRSFLEAIQYFVSSPMMFFYNALIIMLTLSLALLFKRRFFVLSLVSIIWLGCGIANFVLLSFRTTPFSAIDLTMVPYALSIIDVYLSKPQIITLTVILVLVLIGIIIIGIRAPKHKEKMHYLRSIIAVATLSALVVIVSAIGSQTQILESRFGNLAAAYENYGFAYCLSNSFIDSGIKKPSSYSEQAMNDIVDALGEDDGADDAKTPNIIFIQLESFFDVNYLKNVQFSENPLPNFTKLKEKYPSGFLNVPSVGAGTANTEFEVITGMNLDYFGAGEYPYKTILLEETCESLPNNLKERDYNSFAIHNNRASFYGRNEVFCSMGFDTFISKEYMQDLEYTGAGWAKDNCLINEILKSLKSTENQDFIYTITVEGHGKYSAKVLDGTETLDFTMPEGHDRDAYASFFKLQQDVDTFIGDLIDALGQLDEDVVLVMYGDHLPSLEIQPSELTNGNVYQTEYVIWNNMGIEAERTDLASYQLSSYVMNLLGFHNGTLTKYHQQEKESITYLKNLELLEYDMLYGKKYIYNETTPYEPTVLQMGIDPITISDILYFAGTESIYIKGEGFTEASRVYINDDRCSTVQIDNNTLMVKNSTLQEGDIITVKQAGKNRIPLSSTDPFIFNGVTQESIIHEETPEATHSEQEHLNLQDLNIE